MGPVARLAELVAKARRIEPREVFWGAVIVLAVAWFFHVDDPLLAAVAIPVEIVATVAIVRPHIQPPPGDRHGDDEDEGAETDGDEG